VIRPQLKRRLSAARVAARESRLQRRASLFCGSASQAKWAGTACCQSAEVVVSTLSRRVAKLAWSVEQTGKSKVVFMTQQ
jgi:Tfp pilus assembly protein PilV